MQPGQAVSLDSLERELLLLNDLPGLSSRAVVRPGPVYGTSDLVIQSKEKRFEARVSLNNFGRVEVGEWRLEAELTVNNLTGIGDQFAFSGTRSEAGLLTYVSLAYNRPVNNKGTRLGGVLSYIDYDVAGQFKALNIEGENTDFKLTLSHPLQRTRKQNILLGLSLGSNASEASTLGIPTSDADITLLEGSVLFNKIHGDNAVSSLSAILATNFRSNKDGSEENAQKAKLVVDGNHTRYLNRDWSVFFRGLVALSADPLVDSEKFSIGGQGSVRGFPSAEVRGDQGVLFTTELRRRFNLEGTLPGSARVFFDTGRVTRKEPAGLEEEENLTSMGLGVTLLPAKNVSVDLEYAKPIDAHETTDERSGGRFWVNMTARF
jgi:hemolysin activation/secretion protein